MNNKYQWQLQNFSVSTHFREFSHGIQGFHTRRQITGEDHQFGQHRRPCSASNSSIDANCKSSGSWGSDQSGLRSAKCPIYILSALDDYSARIRLSSFSFGDFSARTATWRPGNSKNSLFLVQQCRSWSNGGDLRSSVLTHAWVQIPSVAKATLLLFHLHDQI